MLFPQGLRFAWQRRGTLGAHILASANLWLGGTAGTGGRPVGHFWHRTERWNYYYKLLFFLVGESEDPQGSGNQRRRGMKHSCLLLRGCFAILDEDLLGAGLLSCQENEAVILCPVFIAVPQGWLYFRLDTETPSSKG